MAKAVTMFEAFDGSVFPTEEEATAHDAKDSDLVFIQEFIDSDANIYQSAAQKTMAHQTLLNYLRYMREIPNGQNTD